MSLDLIKFAFISGELSPTFYGRPDLEKFDLGLALARNWFVDYRGGLTTRPGQFFVDWVKDDDKETRMFEFKYSPDLANTYIMFFGHNYVRFIQDGAYVLEAGKAVSAITKADPGVMTVNSHGYSNGDWVKLSGINGMTELNGRTAVVTSATTNTFALVDPVGVNIDTSGYTAYTSSGYTARVYTVVTPYASTDLAGLSIYQQRDVARITHLNFAPRDLTRTAHSNWALTLTSFGSLAGVPGAVTITPSGVGSAGYIFTVTTVNIDGEESIASPYALTAASVDYSVTAGSARVSWTAVANTDFYKIYRSLIYATGSAVTRGAQLGYVGKSFGPDFVDNNTLPDFTETPPEHYTPFAPGRIEHINMTNYGTSYGTNDTTVTVSGGGGSGFVGEAIVDDNAHIIGVVIRSGGSGYSASPTVTFTSGGSGSGAAATAVVTSLTGTYPALSTIFQQRQIYAATVNQPLTLWGSRPKRYSNFDVSSVVSDSDSYEFELDSQEVTPIQHLVSMRGGLLVLTAGGVWQLTGGGSGAPVTPTNALAEPHTYIGVSKVVPVSIDTDLYYVESKGYTIRQLAYNDFSKLYSGTDVSILSNHFFTAKKYVTSWSLASDPFKLIWAVRNDGAMLSFTVVKEQNVFAWTQHSTKGYYKEVKAIQEDRTDAVYMTVLRNIAGRWTKVLEKQAPREITHVEEYFGVDCGLALGVTYPNAVLDGSPATAGIMTFSTNADVFAPGDVGKVLRMGGGKLIVTTYTGPRVIEAEVVRPVEQNIAETLPLSPVTAQSGEWSLDTPVSTIGGLWHLEGETVTVLGDGNVLTPKVVVDGRITLETPCTRVAVGLSFQCVAQTLPLTTTQAVIEGRRKRIMGVIPRLNETRGLKAGRKLDNLYAMRERSVEDYGEPTMLQSGINKTILVQPKWEREGQVYFVEDDPLPASLLGIVLTTEVGDDPN